MILAQGQSPEAVRRAVEQVLSGPDYERVAGGTSLLERVRNAVLEALGRALLRLSPDDAAGSAFGALGLLLVVVLLVVLVVMLLRRYRRTAVLNPVVPGPVGRDARDWQAEAEAHERAGEHREALRCRYRETLALLAERGLIDEVPGRTTGEYLLAVSDALPSGREPFAQVTRTFERVWYGSRSIDGAGLAQVLSERQQVLKAAGISGSTRLATSR